MTGNPISSRVAIRHRYVRSIDLARDAEDPGALDGYVVTPSVRDAAIRILAGLSPESSQRAFRIVGPYGAGKSAFGVFLAQLMRESGRGPATKLLSEEVGGSVDAAPWQPVIVSGRHVSFTRELLRVVADRHGEWAAGHAGLRRRAKAMSTQVGALDVQAVTALVAEAAAELRQRSGKGLLLLIDEMGRFLEYAATNTGTEDPSVFQALAERSGGREGANLAVVGFLHHGFADYVAGMGGWIEAEWSRSAERYEELSFTGSTEQSLFMLARALTPVRRHTAAVRRRSEEIYGAAMDRGLFAASREDVVAVAPELYPLHPSSVAALAWAIRRFGQNERSLFGFLQSLEPAGFKRFAHATPYGHDHWYLLPQMFDHLAATIGDVSGGGRARRWSLAFDGLAAAAGLPRDRQDVLKTVALMAVLEPLPGLVADIDTVAWCLGIGEAETQSVLDELVERSLIYRRSHRGDYSLWSSSSVDLSYWLNEAGTKIPAPERLEDAGALMNPSRPAVAHRHYHETGTLRTFEVRLWTGETLAPRHADGIILIAPVYPGEDRQTVLRNAAAVVADDPLALVCARTVAPDDFKWAHEFALWDWIRSNCEELRLDELARAEVGERIAAAEQAMTRATALLSSVNGTREEEWWLDGKPIAIPDGLSALLSDICDKAYDQAPILRNELINRTRLSSAVASARIRLLGRMLTCADQPDLGMEGAPPERTIHLALFRTSGVHGEEGHGRFGFGRPDPGDPCRWRPVWDRVEERLDSGEATSCAALMEDLARPPYGMRAGPALLVVAAFIVASRDNVAVIERNSFQPDLTAAHFMRLAKSPGNFALKSLREGTRQRGIVQALATRLNVIGACPPTVAGILEPLFAWYNSLPPHASKTRSVSKVAVAVRTALRKASDPERLFFHDLPRACDALGNDGRIDVERFASVLDNALLMLAEAEPSLRLRAAAAASHAFRARDIRELRCQIRNDYGPHRLNLVDYRLRTFVERAMDAEVPDDRWLDGIASHFTGRRPDNWEDGTLDSFDFEIRVAAGNLARWLALARTKQARDTDLKSIHVVGIDGREQVIVIRRERPNPHLETRLSAVREALGNDPNTMEVLGQLLAEHADEDAAQQEKKKVEPA